MRLVVIESPYAGDTPEAIQANVDYGRRCLADSLSRGEAPFASHLLYTQPGVLDDANPGQRSIGIAAGLQWGAASNLIAVYYDRGLSKGMKEGLRNAMRLGLRVELRSLEGRETLTAARCPDGSGYELRSPNWQAALLGTEVESFVLLVKNWVDGELASSPRPAKRPHLMDEMKAEAEKIETAQLVRLGSAEMWGVCDEVAALLRGRAAKADSAAVDKQQAVFAAYACINAPQGTKESIAFIRGAEWQAEHQRCAAVDPLAYGWQRVACEWAEELCDALRGVLSIEDGTQQVAEVAATIQRGITRCRALGVGLPIESAQRDRVAELEAEIEQLRTVASAEPVGVRPYEPTEAMRWAAKAIDPALSHEQIRAIWSSMWSAYATSEVGIPTSQPIGYMHTLDNTDGIPGNEPMREFSRSAENPFGEPGVDYSPEYRRTVRPIYTAPQPDRVAELERQLREAKAEVEQLRGGLEYARDYVDSLVENSEVAHAVVLLRDIDGFLSGSRPATKGARGESGEPVL